MNVRRLATGCCAVVASLGMPSAAAAFYGDGAQIISADFGRLEQGDDASVFSAVSADGRYVAFQTRARNFFADDDPDPPDQFRAGGIFRFDLQSRALTLVADGDFRREDETDPAPVIRGAQNPSTSADGRYVAFSTGQRLVPADTNGNIDVYVRDMLVPIRAPAGAAFDLVSARDGGDVPARYAARNPASPGLDPGSEVTRGVSISADGNRVVFRVTSPSSDLPDSAAIDTPPNQVFVRDRASNTTTLVTRRTSGGAPAGGALGESGISADGSTVVWTGQNATTQTRFLPGENEQDSVFYYLWRRVADGPAAPTRRVTGIADPDADPSACPPGSSVSLDPTADGPCFGPLGDQEGVRSDLLSELPALSADGRRVAFLTGASPRPGPETAPGLDLYITDMSPGVSRRQGTIELTREGTAGGAAASAALRSLSMSRDGRYLALVTGRTSFVLPALRLTGSGRTTPGAQELYVVDLATRSIERATRALDGGDIDSDVSRGATISDGGERVAFISSAGNHFFGDANQRADAFVVTRQPEPSESPPPPLVDMREDSFTRDPGDSDGPLISARARSLSGGRIELLVRVPAAGGVKAGARAKVGRPRRKRVISTGTTRARKAGRVRIVLKPVRRYRREIRRRKRILARANVSFVAARGGRRLRTSIRVAFRHKVPRKRGKR